MYGRNNNFGNGNQTMRIRKSYWLPPSKMTGNKPTKVLVDAYELTFKVNASLPTMTQTPSSTVGVGTGTVVSGGNTLQTNAAPTKGVVKPTLEPRSGAAANQGKTLAAPTAGGANK